MHYNIRLGHNVTSTLPTNIDQWELMGFGDHNVVDMSRRDNHITALRYEFVCIDCHYGILISGTEYTDIVSEYALGWLRQQECI